MTKTNISEKLNPLITKYAYKLHNENLQITFKEAIIDFTESLFFVATKIPVERPEFSNSAIILAYVNIAIKNNYCIINVKSKEKYTEFDDNILSDL